MHVNVRLFGTLPDYYAGDYPPSGLKVDCSRALSVAELVELLQLPKDHIAIVSINGILSKAKDIVPESAEVKFFQALHGG
jgi:sulfur carrier protein ThiS